VESLNVPQTAFCLFYAIFWGLVANAQIRWKAFDWPLAWAGRRQEAYRPSKKRLWRSIWYLTVVPILLFLVIVALLTLPPARGTAQFLLQLLGAVVAAHAAFAPYRLWLSGIEKRPKDFYYASSLPSSAPDPPDPDESESTDAKSRPAAADGRAAMYASQPGLEPEHRLDPRWASTNWWVGVGYIVVSLLFAALTHVFR
jgi:hypothetical protein